MKKSSKELHITPAHGLVLILSVIIAFSLGVLFAYDYLKGKSDNDRVIIQYLDR